MLVKHSECCPLDDSGEPVLVTFVERQSSQIQNVIVAFSNLKNLWHSPDVHSLPRVLVYISKARSVLIYGSKARTLGTEDTVQRSVFEFRCRPRFVTA